MCGYKCEQLKLIVLLAKKEFQGVLVFPWRVEARPFKSWDRFLMYVIIDQCNPIIPLDPHVMYGYMAPNCSLATLNFSTIQKNSRCAAKVNANTSGNKRGDSAEVKCSMWDKQKGSYNT
jgi:hypothetical protein